MEAPTGNGQQTNGMNAADKRSWIDLIGEPVRKNACKALVAKEPCKKSNSPGCVQKEVAADRRRVCEFMHTEG